MEYSISISLIWTSILPAFEEGPSMELSNIPIHLFGSPFSSKVGCFGSIPQTHTPTPLGLDLVRGAECDLVQRIHHQAVRTNHKGGVCNAPAFQSADQTGTLYHKVALGRLGGLLGTPQVHGKTWINLDLCHSDWRRWWLLGKLEIILFLLFQRDKIGPRCIDSCRNPAGDGVALGQGLRRWDFFLRTKKGIDSSGIDLGMVAFAFWERLIGPHMVVSRHYVYLANPGSNSVRNRVTLWQRLRTNDVILRDIVGVWIGIIPSIRSLLLLLLALLL